MTKGWAPEQDTEGTFILCIMILIVLGFFTVFAFCISQIHNNPKPKPEVQIPTEIAYVHRADNSVWMECYHKKGDSEYFHREDGPACVMWDENGNKIREQYLFKNKEYTKEEYLKKTGKTNE